VGSAVKALIALEKNKLGRAIGICFDFVVPQPHDGPALALQIGRAAAIVWGRVSVLTAVKLDRQLCLSAGEIDDVGLDHQLARESGSALPQPNPQQPFRLGRIGAELAGSCGSMRFIAQS
jgi:hypothetical protein